MKKFMVLMAAAAVALLASCSNSAGGGSGSGSGYRSLSVKDFAKYSALGAAASGGVSGNVAAGISASESGNGAEKARLVGQKANGDVEPLSLLKGGSATSVNNRPLQFFKAFKRFVFFMYWPENTDGWSEYGKLLNVPQCNYYWVDGKKLYEPMYVLDKKNGNIYAIDDSKLSSSDFYNKWGSFYYSGNSSSWANLAESDDCFYTYYTIYGGDSSTYKINYMAYKLTDSQLLEIPIVTNAIANSFNGMFLDRFGNLFVNGNSAGLKYYLALDGSKTKINYSDCLFDSGLSGSSIYSVYYFPNGTFSTSLSYTGSQPPEYVSYYQNSYGDYNLDAKWPALYTPLFMGANGYVYKASKDTTTRKDAYKRFNAAGKWEDCDWVPEKEQELDFFPNELIAETDDSKYFFVSNCYYGNGFNSNGMGSNLNISLTLKNSSGDTATVKKYDFTTKQYIDEYIPVVLNSVDSSAFVNSANYWTRDTNTIYKVHYLDSSKNEFEVTKIPLQGFTSSNNYYYYYGSNNYAATKKHLFIVEGNKIAAYDIETGIKAFEKDDEIYGSVSASSSGDKVFYTATSLTSNSSITGTIDDDGIVTEQKTSYDIKYLSPIN